MEVRERAAREVTGSWWLFLITGVAWLIIALVVLRFDMTSIASVGALLGVILLIAGANEFMALALRDIGWKWLHGVLGALFVVGGFWAFIHPMFLPQVQNRLRVERQWLWSYVTGQRA